MVINRSIGILVFSENSRRWLSNCKICDSFLPRKFPAIIILLWYIIVVIDLRDSEVVAASQGEDLPGVTEGGTHHDCLVPILLVVVEDTGD